MISPGGVHFTSGYVNDSSFLWTVCLHCGLSLCQSYKQVTVIGNSDSIKYILWPMKNTGVRLNSTLHLLTL